MAGRTERNEAAPIFVLRIYNPTPPVTKPDQISLRLTIMFSTPSTSVLMIETPADFFASLKLSLIVLS